jgi:hypothetical protein
MDELRTSRKRLALMSMRIPVFRRNLEGAAGCVHACPRL